MRNSKYSSGKTVDISLLLRFEREQKGWSIEYASKKCGIPIQYIDDIENNNFRNFTGDAALLDSYLRMYLNRLNIDSQIQKTLLEFARNQFTKKKFNFLYTPENIQRQ